jgi:hypothetical protein
MVFKTFISHAAPSLVRRGMDAYGKAPSKPEEIEIPTSAIIAFVVTILFFGGLSVVVS